MDLKLARDKYFAEAVNIVTDEDKFLSMKKNDGIDISDMIDFYNQRKGIKTSESFLFEEVRKHLGKTQAKNLTRYMVQDFYVTKHMVQYLSVTRSIAQILHDQEHVLKQR